jgi:hypothetical protein
MRYSDRRKLQKAALSAMKMLGNSRKVLLDQIPFCFKAALPVCVYTDIFGELDDPEAEAAFNLYLAYFLPPQDDCIQCNRNLVSPIIGTYVTGKDLGAGGCKRCGWPARKIHRVGPFQRIRRDLAPIAIKFQGILQYHPRTLIEQQMKAEEAKKK